MGFLGTLYLGLFLWCLQKKMDKPQIKQRLGVLSLVGVVSFFISAIWSATATTNDESEGAWLVILLYLIFFGWRIVLDIISCVGDGSTETETQSEDNVTACEDYEMTREKRWAAKEKEDIDFLNSESPLAKKLGAAVEATWALWETDNFFNKNNEHSEERSVRYLLCLTPELFLSKYYLFKSGNYEDIKDGIYKERPFPVLDTLIKMGLFIFNTKNNIYILEEIINGDREEYDGFKGLAKEILAKERKEV